MNNKVSSSFFYTSIGGVVRDLVSWLDYFNSFKDTDISKIPDLEYMINGQFVYVVRSFKYLLNFFRRNDVKIVYNKSFYEMVKNGRDNKYIKKADIKNVCNEKIFRSVFSKRNIKKYDSNYLISLFLEKIFILNNNVDFSKILNNIEKFTENSNPIENLLNDFFIKKLQEIRK